MCEGGDLDCGSGLLLIIRNAMRPLGGGQVLEIRSRESSVREDLPAWCRLVGHGYLGEEPGAGPRETRYLVRKRGGEDLELSEDLEAARTFEWRTRVRWRKGMRATVYARNHSWEIGQPASFDVADPAASALEHLLGALGACLTVGFQWRCSQRQIEVFNLEVVVHARADNVLVFLGVEEEGHPGLARVEGKAYVDADAEPGVLEELWQDTLRRSPLAQSLSHTVPLDIELKELE